MGMFYSYQSIKHGINIDETMINQDNGLTMIDRYVITDGKKGNPRVTDWVERRYDTKRVCYHR